MSDSNSAIDRPIGMTPGVPMVISLAAGARVGDIVNTLVFLPGGRTRTLSTTVTQDDIYAGRVSRMMPDRAAE